MEEKKEVSAELKKFLDGIWLEAEAKVTQAKQHYESGRRDCECGVYDKWYRYHTRQDGRAYDLGWMARNAEIKNENVKFVNG